MRTPGVSGAARPSSHGRRCRQRPGRRVERCGIRQASTEFVGVGRHGERDAEGSVVAYERAVLDVAEIAADRAGSRGERSDSDSSRWKRLAFGRLDVGVVDVLLEDPGDLDVLLVVVGP